MKMQQDIDVNNKLFAKAHLLVWHVQHLYMNVKEEFSQMHKTKR